MELDDIKKRIDDQYNKLGFDLKYSFLYTGKSTFTPAQKFMFVGLNPGGNGPAESYSYNISGEDNKNSYLDENWLDGPDKEGQPPLQIQLQCFFEALCKHLDVEDWKHYMRNTLCLNYIPFRSKNWDTLGKKKAALEFANELWSSILEYIQPHAILVIDNNVRDNLIITLTASGWTHDIKAHKSGSINWGNNRYYLDYFYKETPTGARRMLIAKLPHLSSRKIFSRGKCEEPREIVVKEIADAIKYP